MKVFPEAQQLGDDPGGAPHLPDHQLPIRLHPVVRAGDAHRPHRPVVHVADGGRHADEALFDLPVVDGVAVEPGEGQLLPQPGGVRDGALRQGPGGAGHPAAVLLDTGVALAGEHGLAGAGGVGRGAAAHLGVADDGPAGLHLVQIEDVVLQQHAEVDGLLQRLAEPLQLRPGGAPQVRPAQDGAGEHQQPGAGPVALAHRVLLQVLPLRQGGHLAVHGGGGQSQPLHQGLEGPLRVPIHKALQDLERPQNTGYLFLGHVPASPVRGRPT